MMLGIPIHDIDYAVQVDMTANRNPEDNDITHGWNVMREQVTARCTKIWEESPEHVTMRGKDPDLGPVDFVLCRKDGPYSDGRHPDWVLPGTIYDDLARRDFTMNAMAIEEGDEHDALEGIIGPNPDALIDPHGGVGDLLSKRIRFVGDPQHRLAQDALRAFRAVRFAITKGMTIDTDGKSAIQRMQKTDFVSTSTDRITDELMLCFKHDVRRTMFALDQFPVLLDLTLKRGIWFMPTTKART